MAAMKVRWLLLLLIAMFIVAALVWPIPASQHWDVTTDANSLAAKAAYLESLSQREVSARPNILLLVADDLGKYDISRYGHTPVATPNINALAEHGLSFSNAYATAAICAPSRAALLTGRYQNRCGFESQPM